LNQIIILSILSESQINDLKIGIYASVIASFSTFILIYLKNLYIKKCYNRKFKKLFTGFNSENLNIILPKMSLAPHTLEKLGESFPFISGSNYVKSTTVTSFSEIQSIQYALPVISKNFNFKDNSFKILSDDSENANYSYIAFGFQNRFFQNFLKTKSFPALEITTVIKLNEREYNISSDFDYGLICRVFNLDGNKNYWMFVGGLAEEGTKGASYYLFKNWKKISAIFDQNNSIIILKIARSNYTVATLVYPVKPN
jgi:hypothetical protein